MHTLHRLAVLALLLAAICAPQRAIAAEPPARLPNCVTTGWNPERVNLKDHTVFSYRGVYYIASIAIAPGNHETRFAYARSINLCQWEDLGLILGTGTAQPWDDWRIWAPFVYAENGTYYMYYTGVTPDVTQSIMLATSTNPADPMGWQPRGMVFQPNHAGMNWPGLGRWSDARDPMVIKADGRYYMYYTGGDAGGGIVGVATAPSPLGPWRDGGAILTLPGAMPESPGVVPGNGWYYLFYNRTITNKRSEVRVGKTPLGPWSAPTALTPGWAHEFWQTFDNRWMTSYLTDYAITIRPVTLDEVTHPPQLLIDRRLWHVWLPLSTSRR